MSVVTPISENGKLLFTAENPGIFNGNVGAQITGRTSNLIQSHNAVSIPASQSSETSTVYSAIGYDQISLLIKLDSSINRTGWIVWVVDPNGAYWVGSEDVVATATSLTGYGRTSVKAPYFKVSIANGDTVLPHTVSSWVNLIA